MESKDSKELTVNGKVTTIFSISSTLFLVEDESVLGYVVGQMVKESKVSPRV